MSIVYVTFVRSKSMPFFALAFQAKAIRLPKSLYAPLMIIFAVILKLRTTVIKKV